MKKACTLIFLIGFLSLSVYLVQGKEGDTFSISLVRQATVKKVEGGEVICENYTVKEGDYIWRLLRQRGLLERPDLAELLTLLKGMNKSLINLDLIHPGQTILIPLNIVPARGYRAGAGFAKESIMGISSLEDIDLESYVVKPGDSLSVIARDRYKVPAHHLYDEYLELVRRFNPTLGDLNLIHPNQVIRLPIYSPEIVRMPIEPEKVKTAVKKTEAGTAKDTGKVPSLRGELGDIFTQMGEEWIDTGEQFIPLRSGAQINLKADSFPGLNLSSGRRLIIDMNNELPADICQLVESDWEDYRIVHLAPGDNLRTVMDKILAASNYHKILKPGEQFKVGGDIGISLAGDWVIIPHRGEAGISDRITVVSLLDNPSEMTPATVRAYLGKLGIKVVDYPDFSGREDMDEGGLTPEKMEIDEGMDFPLPSLLLELAGQPFSRQVRIPVYQGESPKFNLIIQADLFFNRNGRDCIIDLTGLSPAILALLKKHQFLVLSLARVKDASGVTELALNFLGIPFESGPLNLVAASRDETRSTAFSIPGIRFHDREGKKVLATGTKMPVEIALFLNQRGYNLLDLSQFQDQGQDETAGGE